MLSYRLFQLRLLLHLLSLSLVNAFIPIKKRASFAAIEILTALMVGLLMTQVFNVSSQPVNQTVSAALPPIYSEEVNEELLTPEEIEARIIHMSSLLEKQPTHFDLLINLSLLESASGNEDLAAGYWEKAKDLNPNAAIFQDN